NLPIDLKEAILSIIFETPRCSYILELADVKKHMASKYGKECVSATVELRPDCGVGPSTPKKSAYVEPFQVHVPPLVHDEKGPPNSDANTAARKASGNNSATSGMPDIEIKSLGDESQKMDFRDTHSENKSSFPTGRQNWNMEFEGAASTAPTAAECDDRATMAAKAAYSSGLHNSSNKGSRGEAPKDYTFHDDKDLSSGSVNSTMPKSSSGMHNQQFNAGEQDNLVGTPNEHYRNNNQNVVKHSQTAPTIGGLLGLVKL
ncbi:hypothetical protein RYX36_034799, partial [Vicia faba]